MDSAPGPWRIEFHTDTRGRSPALEFIESLRAKEHAAMARVLALLREYGPQLSQPYTRQIEGKLWELRAGSGRLFYFLYIGKRFIILHGYRKKTQRAPRKEIDRAKRYMAEYS